MRKCGNAEICGVVYCMEVCDFMYVRYIPSVWAKQNLSGSFYTFMTEVV